MVLSFSYATELYVGELVQTLDVSALESVDVDTLVKVSKLKEEADVLLGNVSVFANCCLSTNGLDATAKQVTVMSFLHM